MAASLDDYRWLVGENAAQWLTKVAADLAGAPAKPALIRRLRDTLGTERTTLVLEQIELRARAKEKFSRAEELFFTRHGLEQATDELIAAYKAQRFGENVDVTDLCCGIGGDAMALGADRQLTLVDRDKVSLLLASTNVERVTGVKPDGHAKEVAPSHVADNAWHIDPDRRATGQRVSQAELGDPGIEGIESLLAESPDAALKLAPAAQWTKPGRFECEWIETHGECRQQVVWCGKLSTPDHCVATRIDSHGEACSFSGEPGLPVAQADGLKRYVFDPAPSLVAARLVGALAEVLELQSASFPPLYLMSDVLAPHPLLQAFEIEADLPLDVRQLRSHLHPRGIGRLEIKKRGVDVTPEQLRPQLQLRGDQEATLVLTRIGESTRALVCRRVQS